MHPFVSTARRLLHWVARATGFAASAPDFTCSDCERYGRCGMPPHNECVVRATQIARNGQSRFLSRSPLADDPMLKTHP